MLETLAVVLLLLILGTLIATPVAVVVLFSRVRRLEDLERRFRQWERQVGPLPSGVAIDPAASFPVVAAPPASTPTAVTEQLEPVSLVEVESLAEPLSPARTWEDLIGRQALGWIAVIVLLFSTGFFLRYAFENQWIGPLGQVALGIVAGLALVGEGLRRHRLGWRVFAQMLTAGGVVLLYLSIFAAFGFYHLAGQREAGVFLFLLVAESALLALAYEAPAIALMALMGGLLTPVLMHSEHDQYKSLFLYLGLLNAGVIWLLLRRAWSLLGTVALLGTQLLFWGWYSENYHPEKLAWALGFQAFLFSLHWLHSLLVNAVRRRPAGWEDVARMLLNATFGFAAAYILLDDDYHAWLGSIAVALAGVYALSARWLLRGNSRLLLTAVAIAAGLLALAIPLQANAHWVALGWAAEAAVLWWFGVRVRSSPLRLLAANFAVMSMGLVLLSDRSEYFGPPFWPLLNEYALPALAAVACLSLAMLSTRQRSGGQNIVEQRLIGAGAVGCVLLTWFIVSVDLWSYFDAKNIMDPAERDWRRLGQMSLSTWWSAYAALVLTAGFRWRQAWLRWTSLGLFGLTLIKVFFFDMADLDEIYRIVAFFGLAIVLGIAAWAYQRLQPDRAANETVN